MKVRKILIFIVVAMVVFIISGKIILDKINKDLEVLKTTVINEIDLSSIADGTYKGNYTAIPIKVIVEVTIKDNKIEDIRILEHLNGQGKAAEQITDKIIELQKINVDSISGATYSSKVILLAVENALKKSPDGEID